MDVPVLDKILEYAFTIAQNMNEKLLAIQCWFSSENQKARCCPFQHYSRSQGTYENKSFRYVNK